MVHHPLEIILSHAIIESSEPCKCYHPQNARKTSLEVSRYIEAGTRDVGVAQFLTIAGPDGSKIGTDFHCSVGVAANSETGKACALCPQECAMYFIWVALLLVRG